MVLYPSPYIKAARNELTEDFEEERKHMTLRKKNGEGIGKNSDEANLIKTQDTYGWNDQF